MEFEFDFKIKKRGQKAPADQNKEFDRILKESVSHVQKLFSQNKKNSQDTDSEPEPERTLARSVDEGPEPVQESRTKRLDRELRDGKDLYTPLLQMTVDILSMEHQEERASMLLKNWENTLTQCEYEVLREEFVKCRSKWSAEGANTVLKKWLESLEFFGVKQKYAKTSCITVSVENRGDFGNGFEFKDGQRCLIIRHPWGYREMMLRQGELSPDDGEHEGPAEDVSTAVVPEVDKKVSELAVEHRAPEKAPEAPVIGDAAQEKAPEDPEDELSGASLISNTGSREMSPLSERMSDDFSVAGCCSRGIAAADADTYVCEIIFAYCRKDMCGQCPTVYPSPRVAELDAVESEVERAARYASARGYRRFHVCLIGGDSFSAWKRLNAFGEWLWSRQWDMDVRMAVTLCSTELTREMRLWLLRFKDRVTVIFRYNGALGQKLWEKEKLLRHELTDTVCVCVTAETLPELGRLLTKFAFLRKRISLELLDADKWNGEQMEEYISQVAKAELAHLKEYGVPLPLIGPVSCAGPEGRSIITLDTDGSEYPCRYCSPERVAYSIARNRTERFMETGNGCEAWIIRRDSRPNLARVAELNAGLCRRIDKVAETIKNR